jgi:predicted RNA binding protein YcfA (HicA-like mRNA interferase family)
MSANEVIQRLEKLGFSKARQRGSHIILKKQTPSGEVGCVVPLHKQLAIGTLRGIIKQAKLTVEQFTEQKP